MVDLKAIAEKVCSLLENEPALATEGVALDNYVLSQETKAVWF